jgi:hypothetical protein
MTDWDKLLKSVETVEGNAPAAKVVVPEGLVALITKLRDGRGPNGGTLRATLPNKPETLDNYNLMRRTLRAAGNTLEPKISVTTKAVYDAKDEINVGTAEEPQFKISENAVPIAIVFSVGERRGRKTDAEPDA